MIRPAERFAVNITQDEPALRLSRPSRWSSLPMLIALAAVLGAGIGGMLPSGWGPAMSPQLAAVAPGRRRPRCDRTRRRPRCAAAGAEGTGSALLCTGAARPGPGHDAARAHRRGDPPEPGRRWQAVGRGCGELGLQVAEVALGAARLGPVQLRVGPPDAAASVLGADILDRLAVVSVDGGQLSLSPR